MEALKQAASIKNHIKNVSPKQGQYDRVLIIALFHKSVRIVTINNAMNSGHS